MTEPTAPDTAMSRRNVLRAGAVGAAAFGLGAGKLVLEPNLAQRGLLDKDGVFGATSMAFADSLYSEAFPTSPLILKPFTDQLPIPKALKPVSKAEYSNWAKPPGPGLGQQNSLGNQQHQIWPTDIIAGLPGAK